MKLRHTAIATISALAFSAAASAVTSPPPAQILCIPDEHHRMGIEKLDTPGSEAHLFEYGGKVTIKTAGDSTQYEYGEGQHFFRLKEKTAFANDFVDIQQDIFLHSDPMWSDSSGFLILAGQNSGGYFHINWTENRYYGYTHQFGSINTYTGTCSILKK
jgi:opacity protein-like surface antigen